MAQFFLSECLLIKNENQYLIEHITRNHQAGIEHFYIYDNVSDVSVESFLQANAPELLELCTIEILPDQVNDVSPLTETAYNSFLQNHRTETTWCAFIDTDEMFTGDLAELVRFADEKDYKALEFHWLIHGSAGQAYYEDKPLFERFEKFNVVTDFVAASKMVAKLEYVLAQKTHETILMGDAKPVQVPAQDSVILHHFLFKSWEEFLQKAKRGHVFQGWASYKPLYYAKYYKDVPRETFYKLLRQYGFTY